MNKSQERKQAELAWFLAIEAQHGMPALVKAINANRRALARRIEREKQERKDNANG
jgi:hypothetical protein